MPVLNKGACARRRPAAPENDFLRRLRRVALVMAMAAGAVLTVGIVSAAPTVIPLDDDLLIVIPAEKKEPSELSHPLGKTPFADNYIRNYPYGVNAVYVDRTVYVPTPQAPGSLCRGIQVQRPYCAPDLPTYEGSDNSCTGVITTSKSIFHSRPAIGEWRPTMHEGRAGYVRINSGCSGVGNPDGICAVVTYSHKLMVADPIGQRENPAFNCGGQDQFWASGRGWDSHEVFPGEITPEGWGLVPLSNRLFDPGDTGALLDSGWQVLVPLGKRVSVNGIPGADYGKGDAYWVAQPVNIPSAVYDNSTFGGAPGPGCWPGHSECWKPGGDGSRARASLVNGKWKITITGYMTDGMGPLRNTQDYVASLGTLAGLNSGNPTVQAVMQFLDERQIPADQVELYGHSLGALDATVLFQLGYGTAAVGLATPLGVPSSALKSTPVGPYSAADRSIRHYCGVNDPICNPYLHPDVPFGFWLCTGYLNRCRRDAGVDLVEINTGTGVLSNQNPHDRGLYEQLALGANNLF